MKMFIQWQLCYKVNQNFVYKGLASLLNRYQVVDEWGQLFEFLKDDSSLILFRQRNSIETFVTRFKLLKNVKKIEISFSLFWLAYRWLQEPILQDFFAC